MALRGLRLVFFIKMFRLSVNFILTLSGYHCIPRTAYVNLKLVVGQTHDDCSFPLKRKKKKRQACGSANEPHGVIQCEVLGEESFGC